MPFLLYRQTAIGKCDERVSSQSDIEIDWKSFQLNPAMKTEPGKNITQYLSEVKGWSVAQAKQANDYVTNMAKELGLNYDFTWR